LWPRDPRVDTSAKLDPLPTARRERVLVIDDDQVALELVSAALMAAGYGVIARHAPPTLVEVRRLGVGAVVCDLCMDGMDGDRVVMSFHNDPELRGLPFVLISADAVRLEQALSRMPWLHCLRKDAALLHVASTLEKLIERARVAGQQAGKSRFSEPNTGSLQRPSSAHGRDRARQRFVELVRETTRALRPYLIGGVLGPRAHGEVKRRYGLLRSEAALATAGSPIVEALGLVEQLADRAQRDPRATELLSGCNAWLDSLDEGTPFPATLDAVPVMRDLKQLLT
jgi:CheY-like chemotaxis protein